MFCSADCSDIDLWTQRQQPIQTIYLRNRTLAVTVLCDDGWTVLQRNERDASAAERTWRNYEYGFGSLSGHFFWIGAAYMHDFTQQDDYQLRVDMTGANGRPVTSDYAYFNVGTREDWYRLEVSDNSGPAGDILGVHSATPLINQPFSTSDRALDTRYTAVAAGFDAGWWYPLDTVTDGSGLPIPCFTHLNHRHPWYCPPGANSRARQLAKVSMKIRPNSIS